MSDKIFISYRREDSAGYAGRVRDRLVDKLGKSIFMDVDNIPLGTNFVKALQDEVGTCSALLAVIGKDWLDVRDKNGRRRLDNPNDSVRVEIGTALQRDIPVIPILLEGTVIPSADQLPEDLQELSLRNGINVHHASFQADMDRLIQGLKRQSQRGNWRDQFGARRLTRRTLLATAAATGTAAVAVGAYRVLMVKEATSPAPPKETPTDVASGERRTDVIVKPTDPAAKGPIAAITTIAGNSPLARVSWRDRGGAPIGYIKGMALTYARVCLKLSKGDAVALAMANADTGDSNRDALAHYAPQFAALGMRNDVSGTPTLRHLFVLLIGLGMRTSWGRYCEGWDRSAPPLNADSAEAGLFQPTFDSRGASPLLMQLFADYLANSSSGFADVFGEGVTCRDNDFANFGSGMGATFQELSKRNPAFSVEWAAVGLRNIRKHWGPINRREVELRPECDDMLRQVEELVNAQPSVFAVLHTVGQPGFRVAKSILTLRDQIDKMAPGRDKSNDGTIGDTSSQARKSDHNPNSDGVVTAIDITHDPSHGVDAGAIVEALRASRDPRIKYIIWNRRTFSSEVNPWEWRPYTGPNPAENHFHLSVVSDQLLYDDESKLWMISARR